MSSMVSVPKRFALILIDPQNGFVHDGCWSRMFPVGQSTPILDAFHRIVLFLRAIPSPSSVPVLISETGFSRHDRQVFEPIANKLSQRGFLSITRTFKPHTNLAVCSGVRQWLEQQLAANIDVVIGGCTTTSCVRDSSIQIKRMFPQLNLIVDRNLCAARTDNYVQRCGQCLERYMIYAASPRDDCELCSRKDSNEQVVSPVEFAFQQMTDAGVNVVETYSVLS